MYGKVLAATPLVFLFLFGACTKKEETHTPDGKPVFSKTAGDPEKLILEAEVDVPQKHRKKVTKKDLLLWVMKDGSGQFLAGGLMPVPLFPHRIVVRAKQLAQPVAEGASLILDARIVAFGDEGKPPKKGQLHLLVGSVTPAKEEAVVKPAVKPEVLEKFLKRNPSLAGARTVLVGEKLKAEFTPWTM